MRVFSANRISAVLRSALERISYGLVRQLRNAFAARQSLASISPGLCGAKVRSNRFVAGLMERNGISISLRISPRASGNSEFTILVFPPSREADSTLASCGPSLARASGFCRALRDTRTLDCGGELYSVPELTCQRPLARGLGVLELQSRRRTFARGWLD